MPAEVCVRPGDCKAKASTQSIKDTEHKLITNQMMPCMDHSLGGDAAEALNESLILGLFAGAAAGAEAE